MRETESTAVNNPVLVIGVAVGGTGKQTFSS